MAKAKEQAKKPEVKEEKSSNAKEQAVKPVLRKMQKFQGVK